ncbi:MAG: hypothetical protein ABSH04_04440 [Acidimicrobiales bacterium]|jgi:hypothetical protein
MDRLLGTVVSRALRRGLRGEPLWLAVGVGAWLWRRGRHRAPQTIWSGRVEPGARLLISTLDPEVKSKTAPAEG